MKWRREKQDEREEGGGQDSDDNSDSGSDKVYVLLEGCRAWLAIRRVERVRERGVDLFELVAFFPSPPPTFLSSNKLINPVNNAS
jgi:hypothetical protein